MKALLDLFKVCAQHGVSVTVDVDSENHDGMYFIIHKKGTPRKEARRFSVNEVAPQDGMPITQLDVVFREALEDLMKP